MSAPTTYLVTGGNRGIGRGFVQTFLQRPSTTVIAAVRDPSSESSKSLQDLPKGAGSKLITVKLDSSIETDAAEAVARLQTEHEVSSIDVVIANAGISLGGAPVRQISARNIAEHFIVNTTGPVTLFQATADLLQASKTGKPVFVAISSLIGSIGSMEALAGFPATQSPYGGSKAALNWFVRRLHFEEPWLTSFVFHPGLVETELANAAVEGLSLKLLDLGAISVEASVSSMVKTLDTASRDTSGTFRNHDGSVIPW
ncbi:SDR family oxidoreductase [Aspergillus glaucus CBS 516.65]|uniref:Ketoreductase (KR) domain-containing protein n=1 Tax=Aspergillus glaucus CBS 516.65 TaxID=1160497 RepID=A0A1L9VXN8_ASPGL|nr:hypothetical protein ASPGLDRAFT_163263 [Aspergillus glaucus CBS 516.65]OJJ88683.1 hypothetical protein ASPGLDRAFT_163263 [Aspergillus glaucus CBS 516.65]